jgi:hypothetical protein
MMGGNFAFITTFKDAANSVLPLPAGAQAIPEMKALFDRLYTGL